MPKFLWCIDVSAIEDFKENKITGRAFVDPTCHSHEQNPWILLHDKESYWLDHNENDKEIPI